MKKPRSNVAVRAETAADIGRINRVIEAAFREAPYSSHAEQFIVDELRRCDGLSISLVAVDQSDDTIVGHVAISPVTVSSGATGWYGLGPVAVQPDRQNEGIGSTLVRAALAELQRLGGAGCVVLGDPRYYSRFGFKHYPGLELPGVPPDHFLALSFGAEMPIGHVDYHEAFEATA